MLIIPPPKKFPRKRTTEKPPAGSPPPTPPPPVLTLVSAVYEAGQYVALTFDRPIDFAGLDVAAVSVADGDVADYRYVGSGTPMEAGAATVEVLLNGVAAGADPGVRLTVGPGNGIVAADDGGTWPGVDGLSLPFP